MYLAERKFFRRKSKKLLYRKYKTDYNYMVWCCNSFLNKFSILEDLIHKYRTTACVYEYLRDVKNDYDDKRRFAYTYVNRNSSLDILFDIKDYQDLTNKISDMSMAISAISNAIFTIERFEGYVECGHDITNEVRNIVCEKE